MRATYLLQEDTAKIHTSKGRGVTTVTTHNYTYVIFCEYDVNLKKEPNKTPVISAAM